MNKAALEKLRNQIKQEIENLNHRSNYDIKYKPIEIGQSIDGLEIVAELAPDLLHKYYSEQKLSLPDILNIDWDIMDENYFSAGEKFIDIMKTIYLEAINNRKGYKEKERILKVLDRIGYFVPLTEESALCIERLLFLREESKTGIEIRKTLGSIIEKSYSLTLEYGILNYLGSKKYTPYKRYNPYGELKELVGATQYIAATINMENTDKKTVEFLTKLAMQVDSKDEKDFVIEAAEAYKSRKKVNKTKKQIIK